MLTLNHLTKLFAVLVLALGLSSTVLSQEVVSTGSFSGINNHTSTGGVSIVKNGDTYQIVLAEDFVFDGAPDPKVALGKDGTYDPATLIRLLDSNTGAQTYEIPASIDISAYNEVHIWCEKYAVGLAIAPLN